MNFVEIGKGATPSIVFAHGWDRTHADFIPTAEALVASRKSLLIDLPGFGETPKPPEAWDTRKYADHAAQFIREKIGHPIVWVGHSFGGRVGMRLGVQHPDVLSGLVLVGCAGLQMTRPPLKRLKGRIRGARFRMLRQRAKTEAEIIALEKRFGSADYVHSRDTGLRDIFLKTVNEDQAPDLPRIKTPTVVLNGARDTETPPAMGQRIASLIPGARFLLLPEFDHISVLFRGHHIIALRAKEMSGGSPQ